MIWRSSGKRRTPTSWSLVKYLISIIINHKTQRTTSQTTKWTRTPEAPKTREMTRETPWIQEMSHRILKIHKTHRKNSCEWTVIYIYIYLLALEHIGLSRGLTMRIYMRNSMRIWCATVCSAPCNNNGMREVQARVCLMLVFLSPWH